MHLMQFVAMFTLQSLVGNHPPAITALAVCPDAKCYIQSSQAGVVFHHFDGKQKRTIPSKLDHVHAIAFSPDGKTLAVAGGSPAENGVVELWSWPQMKLCGQLQAHKDVVYDVVFLHGGKQLATASADRTIRLWDSAKQTALAVLKGHSGPVLALAATQDGNWLCSASADYTIRVWNVKEKKLVRALTNHLGPVQDLAFRPPTRDGRPPYLASASSDKTIRIWQPTIGRMVRIIRHPTPIAAIVWTRDGEKLISGAKDGKVRIIDAESDEILGERAISKHRISSLAVNGRTGDVLVGDGRGNIERRKIGNSP